MPSPTTGIHLRKPVLALLLLMGGIASSAVLAAEERTPTASESLQAEASAYRGPAADADKLTFVTVNGVQLAYRLEGSGIPVVFVHGESYSHEL
ncbi:MAG TPA: hypothetical protein VFG52_03140, partial [Xanthomonadales bacterium]|nr:hypothetical protein [Xanthomonadales bacterium]